MSYTLGIDIGTFESKGVIVDATGTIIATATAPHEMIVPQPGWAEHRADQDWWDDFCTISRQLLAQSGIEPEDIKAVATSAIGPCMLPVDADGKPLMNAVLYGVDTRAEAEIEELTDPHRRRPHHADLRQCADLAIGRPENPLAEEQPPEDLRPDREDPVVDHLPRLPPDRRIRHRSLHGGQFQPAL